MIQAGVIGTGYLGRFHAQKLAAHPEVELVGLVDVDESRVREVAEEVGAQACLSPAELLGRVEAVCVVTPAPCHFEQAREFLAAGVHVLLEKPMTETLDQADELIELAEERNLILQVGLLERFNPVTASLRELVEKPRFIEAHRVTPYVGRGTDVDVVLDLMIHDIDIVLSLLGEMPTEIRALGAPLLSEGSDMTHARLDFPSGCVVNLNAARVSSQPRRRIKVYQDRSAIHGDFGGRTVAVFNRTAEINGRTGQEVLEGVFAHRESFPASDALDEEIKAFINSIRTGDRPQVDGPAGRRALAVALEIIEQADSGGRQGG